jgi:hypothetical protein
MYQDRMHSVERAVLLDIIWESQHCFSRERKKSIHIFPTQPSPQPKKSLSLAASRDENKESHQVSLTHTSNVCIVSDLTNIPRHRPFHMCGTDPRLSRP